MSYEAEYPYKKLANTPLASDTKLCGLQPKKIAIILAVVSILIDIIPCISIAAYMLTTSKKQGITSGNIPRFICAALGAVASVIHLIGIIVLCIGAARDNVHLYYCWFCTICCHIMMGKFAFSFFLILLGSPLAGLIFVLILLDIPLIVFMFMAFGKTAAIARNKRYLTLTTKFTIKPENNP